MCHNICSRNKLTRSNEWLILFTNLQLFLPCFSFYLVIKVLRSWSLINVRIFFSFTIKLNTSLPNQEYITQWSTINLRDFFCPWFVVLMLKKGFIWLLMREAICHFSLPLLSGFLVKRTITLSILGGPEHHPQTSQG